MPAWSVITGTLRDPRVRHARRLRRARSRFRRTTVLTALVGGATAVLVPYQGVGILDVGWGAATAALVAGAFWRGRELRDARRAPVPEPPHGPAGLSDGEPGSDERAFQERWADAHPAVRVAAAAMTAAGGVPRALRDRVPARSSAAPGHRRLRAAHRALDPLVTRLGSAAGSAGEEAAAAEGVLRDLTLRIVAVERAADVAPPDAAASLHVARDTLADRLATGVGAYERLVAAAAEAVAAQADVDTSTGFDFAVRRLDDAAESLGALAGGLADMSAERGRSPTG